MVGEVKVGARIESSVAPAQFRAQSREVPVGVNSRGDIILTNRHLLFERYDDPSEIATVLQGIHDLAYKRGAHVFYVDWWDLYDGFAKNSSQEPINPPGKPLFDWDREGIDYTSEETANRESRQIDAYVHYWSEQLGGLDEERYLLIVSDDSIVPMFRLGGFPESWVKDLASQYYDVSSKTLRAAEANLIYSDVIYGDTDNKSYQAGHVENIFVGRLVGQRASELRGHLENNMTVKLNASRSIVLAYPEGSDQLMFVPNATTVASDLALRGFEVNKENGIGLFDGHNWSFSEFAKELFNPFSFAYYSGHGSAGSAYSLSGWNLYGNAKRDETSAAVSSLLSAASHPYFFFSACLTGLFDRDWDREPVRGYMVSSLVANNAGGMLGATATTMIGINLTFGSTLTEKLIGVLDIPLVPVPIPVRPAEIGRALKSARNSIPALGGAFSSGAAYQIYGVPWARLEPAAASESAPAAAHARSTEPQELHPAESNGIRALGSSGAAVRQIRESVSNYTLEKRGAFDLVSIPGYRQLERDSRTPVLPVKRFQFILPNDTSGIAVHLTPSNPQLIGQLNVPVFSDQPDTPDGVKGGYYLTAPASLGLFSRKFDWFDYLEGGNRVVVIDLFPLDFDAGTRRTTLYHDVVIEVSYQTGTPGVMISAATDKSVYAPSQDVLVDVLVQNVSPIANDFTVTSTVRDESGSTVSSSQASATIGSASLVSIPLRLVAPDNSGGYWVECTLGLGSREIASSTQLISVEAGELTASPVPRIFPGGAAELKARYASRATMAAEVTMGLQVFSGATRVATFVPLVFQVGPGLDAAATFVWNVPPDFPAGNYVAVFMARSGGRATAISREFGVGALDMGWNLVSLPLQPSDPTLPAVLHDIAGRFESVWAYQGGKWRSYIASDPGFSDLSSMQGGGGYWLKLKIAANLSVVGTAPPAVVPLSAGWNLVGYNSTNARSVENALGSIMSSIVSVWTWVDGAWRVYVPTNPGVSDLTTLEPGRGYWIKTSAPCTWSLPTGQSTPEVQARSMSAGQVRRKLPGRPTANAGALEKPPMPPGFAGGGR